VTELQVLCKAAMSCTACDLSKQRTKVVPGDGSETTKVLFIGEAPGYYEDQEGRPFVGAAGKLLTQLMGLANLKREDVYITNTVKCRPPGNRDPMPVEIATCKSLWLDKQLALIKPRIIVTLGRYSMAMFLPKETISKAHGLPRRVGDTLIYPIHHPAAALHQQALRSTIEADFKKLATVIRDLDKVQEEAVKPKQLNLFN